MHTYLFIFMVVVFVLATIWARANPIKEPPCEKCGKEVEDCNCFMSYTRDLIEYLDNI